MQNVQKVNPLIAMISDLSGPEKQQKTEARKQGIRKLLRLRYVLRWMPRKGSLKRYPVLGKYGNYLRSRKYLWSFKESYVGPAIFIGSIVAFLPLFGVQLLTVTAIALIMKVNLPVLAGLQFISNPLTLVPIYLANYKVGSWLLGAVGFGTTDETTLGTIYSGVNSTMIGGMVLGSVVGLFLYGIYRIRLMCEE